MRLSCLAALLWAAAAIPAVADTLRVCADPNNMPFSDRAGDGFENKIARLVARDLKMAPEFIFQRQTENFLDKGLNAGLCDVVMGVPARLADVAVTQPYYVSSYVFVTRADEKPVASLTDPRLKRLRIGVHLIGDEGQPPAEALGREGIVSNVRGFMIDDDYAGRDPPARLIEAVADRRIDVAAAWGPLGGYFAKRSAVPLSVTPITGTERFAPLVFRFAIAAGVRKTDGALRNQVDAALIRNHTAIEAVLKSFGVPLLPLKGGSHE